MKTANFLKKVVICGKKKGPTYTKLYDVSRLRGKVDVFFQFSANTPPFWRRLVCFGRWERGRPLAAPTKGEGDVIRLRRTTVRAAQGLSGRRRFGKGGCGLEGRSADRRGRRSLRRIVPF